MKIEGNIKQLSIEVGQIEVGRLSHDSIYRFTYTGDFSDDLGVAMGMPVRDEQYTRGELFPIFQMNLPEGYVRRYISERMIKTARINDMLFLALSGATGSGRLIYGHSQIDDAPPEMSLSELLSWDSSESVFDGLVDKYLLQTTAGISGIQPKVVIPEARSTIVVPSLIVKSGAEEYPNMAVNEYLCMETARLAGMETPDFWLSDNHKLFVMRRFDIDESGGKLGLEDFSVLLNRPGDKKYEGSYENLIKVAGLYQIDIHKLYQRIVLSIVLGDGDAHLKNFAVIYKNPTSAPELSPVYDVVNTQIYNDHQLALKIDGNRDYPRYDQLISWGKRCGIKDPALIVNGIVQAWLMVEEQHVDLLEEYPDIQSTLSSAVNNARPQSALLVNLAPSS